MLREEGSKEGGGYASAALPEKKEEPELFYRHFLRAVARATIYIPGADSVTCCRCPYRPTGRRRCTPVGFPAVLHMQGAACRIDASLPVFQCFHGGAAGANSAVKVMSPVTVIVRGLSVFPSFHRTNSSARKVRRQGSPCFPADTRRRPSHIPSSRLWRWP